MNPRQDPKQKGERSAPFYCSNNPPTHPLIFFSHRKTALAATRPQNPSLHPADLPRNDTPQTTKKNLSKIIRCHTPPPPPPPHIQTRLVSILLPTKCIFYDGPSRRKCQRLWFTSGLFSQRPYFAPCRSALHHEKQAPTKTNPFPTAPPTCTFPFPRTSNLPTKRQPKTTTPAKFFLAFPCVRWWRCSFSWVLCALVGGWAVLGVVFLGRVDTRCAPRAL